MPFGLTHVTEESQRVVLQLLSNMAVACPDFNRPVTLQLEADPAVPSPHNSSMLMEDFFKRYFGETPQAPHGSKFKPDPKAVYEHSITVKFPDPKSKKKLKMRSRQGKDE